MSDPPAAREAEEQARAARERLPELVDPEASPGNPTSTLAAAAAPEQGRTRAPARAPEVSSGEIARLAGPAMLSLTLASIVGMADILMVGRLGREAQAAVGVAQQLFFVAQSALFALSFACVALMARNIGAGEAAQARRALAASLVVSAVTGLLLFAALGLAPAPLLAWLGAEPAVAELCAPYLRLVMGSTLLTALALAIESGLRADRDTVTPMLVAAALTLVKIVLNGVFMFGWLGGPEWGVRGAGIATLLSQCGAAAVFLCIAFCKPARQPSSLRLADFRGIGSMFSPLLRIAAPGVCERLVMNLAMISYFKFVGGYGTAAIAAYTIGIRILSFSWIPGTGYSQAVATLVGQSLGAGNVPAATRAGWRAARLALWTAVAMGALGAVFRRPLAELFSTDPETVAALGPFMLCLSLAQPAMQLHFTLAGAFRGAGDTITPFWAAVLGNWLFRVPLAWLLASVLGWRLEWIWAVLILDHFSRAIWLAEGFRRGAWRRRARGGDQPAAS